MDIRGTTICGVMRYGKCAIAGDGQITLGKEVILKNTARKVRRIYNDSVIIGFAGSVADAFSLSSKFEAKLEQFAGNLERAAVELALEWREDKVIRQLEAMLIAADKDNMLIISGTGEVIVPDSGILAIGSGGMYAYSAAKGMIENTELSAKEIAQKSLEIAAEVCVFTNKNITLEEV